jgi:hypothetical protein
MVLVRFLKNTLDGYQAGEVREVTPDLAAALIESHTAELTRPEVETATPRPPERAIPRRRRGR